MFIIREDQLDAVRRVTTEEFKYALLDPIKKFYPREYSEIGESNGLKIVELAMERGSKYGFASKRQLLYYLSLMFLFGSDFDTDPQLSWLREAFESILFESSSERMLYAWQSALDYIELTAGAENQCLVRALVRLRRTELADLPQELDSHYCDKLCDLLQKLYPEKYSQQHKARTLQIIEKAKAVASIHQVDSAVGVGLTATLMYFLGHGFYQDRLFPWANELLNVTLLGSTSLEGTPLESTPLESTPLESTEERVEKLYQRSKIYLDEVLTNK